MTSFVDGFARTWTQAADGSWSTSGCTISERSIADAQAFAADHWPDGYVPPPIAPVVAVPQSVAAWQAKAACYLTPATPGPTLLDNITAAVNAKGGVTVLAFNGAATWERGSDFIATLAAGLGLTGAQIDALFVQAAQISG